tara:strand:+ start:399 stop:707 length:309 start_codon:yes stop_codon:yes gene_type:complete
MKNIILIFCIIFLILTTTIIKNSTKELESQTYNTRENINVLKDKYELILLDHNYLTSPKKLLDYQFRFFENELSSIDINDIKELILNNNNIIIQDFNQVHNE